MTYMLGYDSQGSIVFNFVEQDTCSSNWSNATWTSLPYPGGGKPYHTEECFLTSTHHFAVQYEGGVAIWDHWARTWTYRDIPCAVTYPNNAAMVNQDSQALIDDILIQWEDSKGAAHLTGVQLYNDTVNACNELSTTNVPTDMKLAAAPDDGKTFFLFGPKGSCWYDITAATTLSSQPIQTTSECHSLPALNISVPRATNYDGSIYIFGKNDVGVGVWSVNTANGAPYSIVPLSQGAPISGDFSVANCGTGIIVYGGCASADQCSTNLQPGEAFPPNSPTPPAVIYVPGTSGSGGSGSGGSGSGGSGSGGSGSGGSGSGGSGSGGSGSGGSGSGGSGSGSWIPAPTGIPTGIPSGGPTVVPTVSSATTIGVATSVTAPGVLPSGGADTSSKTNGNNHTGAIIGGIIGCLCLIFLIALIFVFARKKRRERYPAVVEEEEVIQENYSSAHGDVPPIIPVPIFGNENETAEGKDLPGPTGVPTGDSSAPGPNGSGRFAPVPVPAPVPAPHHSHTGEILAGGLLAGGVLAAAAHHKKEEEEETEEVSNGHVVPVPAPIPETESSSDRDAFVPIPVPVPTSGNSDNQPSGPGGFFPPTTTTKTTTEETEEIEEVGPGTETSGGKKREEEKTTTVTSETTTTTRNGHRVFTTAGPGGRTVETEITENGPRHVLMGVIPGTTTVRTITQRTKTGEEVLIPVEAPQGDEREVITEHDEHGNLRYIIGGIVAGGLIGKALSGSDSESGSRITTVTSSTRIVTERTSTGEIRHVIVGGFSGNAIRVLTERTSNGETRLIPTNEPTGELHHVISERSENGDIRYIIGGIVAGGAIRTITQRTESGGETRYTIGTVTSTTRIVTERITTGEIRYIIVGGFAGNAIRVFTERTPSGETRLIATNDETGELRQVFTERSETGEIRYIIGGVITNVITRVIMGPRIVSERTSTGEIRYVIIDKYNGNAIRTKFEINEETGEYVHIPVKEPEGELRYVNEERTESGEIRKVVGGIITGNVTTTTRTIEGVNREGPSTSTQTRIVAEKNGSEVRYYHITNGPDGQELRTEVERTEDGGFRTLAGVIIVGAGATLIGNNQTTTTTRVVPGGTLTAAEQAANKTQITLKLSIMRYERADASQAVPNAAIGTVMFSKFKMLAAGDVNIEDTAYSHVEETKTQARRTVKWMKTEAHWKREAGMLQHLKSDRYIADLYTLYSLPTFAEYRYVSILGSFNCTLETYLKREQLSSIQVRQLTASLSDALRWCHEHHVVHLNIRPASFYLDGIPGQDGNGQLVWKLWNFGHARFVGETVDTSVTTVTYAAPEILNGRKKSDANVLSAVSMDRWSLGLIIYELHARKVYFTSNAFAEFQLTSEEGTKFEPALEAVREDDARQAIRGLLEVDPERRFTHETLREVYFGRA
ncbi:Ribosomal protein S6 kinase alpha-4 [Entomortierella chlamydospora]|uniref:Ribosomal protein S6 kinase alpha-4 n=1 Tax=Entomortierella chlamydospora TaxID=101097 RepID=A0A9P6MPN6_9FUNG|nr:Ribosomal protein S6 kinase alpha-4 [Entomortierella chlamydospora]